MVSIQYILRVAEEAAREAGSIIMDIYRGGQTDIMYKQDASPVTRADEASQQVIIRRLEQTGWPVLSEESAAAAFDIRRTWNYCWLVDPLDGTKEFIERLEDFTVNIAWVASGVPVAGVVHAPYSGVTWLGAEETGVWKKTKAGIQQLLPLARRMRIDDLRKKAHLTAMVSRHHLSGETRDFLRQLGDVRVISMGSSLKFMALTEGKADLYPRLGKTMEWDTAAGHAILNASRRGVYDLNHMTELKYNKPDLFNPSFVAF